MKDLFGKLVGQVVYEKGQFHLPAGSGQDNVCRSLVRGHIQASLFICHLAKVLRRRSQFSEAKVKDSEVVFHAVIDFIAHTVDYSFVVGEQPGSGHLALPELYRNGSSRPRRIGKTFKLSVSEAAHELPSLRNAQQLLAARRVFLHTVANPKKKQQLSRRGVAPGAGRTFCQDNMMAYIAGCQLELNDCPHGYVSMDATRVSSKDLMFYVFEGLPAMKSCWLVPKAPLRGKGNMALLGPAEDR
eukprot:289144-Heterocapsa_arctica.AAC.1